MNSEPLSLDHKELIAPRLKALGLSISEYSFANLYLFRRAHHYEVISDRELFIQGRSYDGYSYLMPIFDVRNVSYDYLMEMSRTADYLFPISEEWLPVFGEKDFSFSSKNGEADYTYTVEKMSTYKGRNLHAKRNLMKNFLQKYSHTEAPLTEDRKKDAHLILEGWREDSGQDENEADFVPCREALELSEELLICGGIFYADNEPAGFILGEELDPETFVLHFAKARKKFRGIYQYMFNSFAKVLPEKYRLLNLEQDLDKEPLRIAKSSYLPDRMIRKMRVSRRR